MLRFSHRGVEYVYDELRMSAPEAMAVKKFTGLGMLDLMKGVASGDPDAVVALVMLAQLRAGELKHGEIKWDDLVASFDDENGLMALLQTFDYLNPTQEAEYREALGTLGAVEAAPVEKPAKPRKIS